MLWSGWYDYVLPRANGLTVEFAEENIRLAAREFCERSKAVVMEGADTATAAETTYPLAVPAGYELVKVRQVWYAGKKLPAANPAQLDQDYGDYWPDLTGVPKHWTHDGEIDTLRLVPRHVGPDQPMKWKVAVKPTLASTGLRDDFAEKFHEAIGEGALSKVLGISRRPWYDPQRGAACTIRFNAEIDRAHAMAARGFAGDFVQRNGRRRFM
jgi:hypothetical protein